MPARPVRPFHEATLLLGLSRRVRAGSVRGCPSRPVQPLPLLAGVGAVLGLVVYLLPLYAAVPRTGPAGAGDRSQGIVFSRHRQVQFDVVADDRPLPRPSVSAVPPACVPGILTPEVTGCSGTDAALTDRASRPASSSRPRSPPTP